MGEQGAARGVAPGIPEPCNAGRWACCESDPPPAACLWILTRHRRAGVFFSRLGSPVSLQAAPMSPRFLSRLRRSSPPPRSHDPVWEVALVWQFGCRLRALRKRQGLTRSEVSKTGIDEEDLTLMEAGRLEPTLSAHLVPLARALDVSLRTLFEGAGRDVPPVSPDTGTVLRAMATEVGNCWLGPDLSDETDLPSGRLYPALATLERGGMVACSTADPKNPIVPDLCRYVLTPLGEEMARFVPPAWRHG